ncbi:putative transmembrane ascorbate-dependent reductase CYB561 homolog [Uloborus diversus]|uniref:putative transmembrane ascorbate-dependent reductase CYB561 homolog n=1 Tax=Uloborus diversus TaxID=327109 RepID=UPI002409967C|nr:putative transmembrane ascorbate-dependent reductase CYB561 homolog [Uloborus diversus]XP_054712182.1 putative transmembrane ascorbate-dependent reductase CYB561 homolog [Uloborus diversus]
MEGPRFKIYQTCFAMIIFLGILIVTLVFIWTKVYLGGFGRSDDPLHHFNYHPVCAVIGLVIIYGKGILLFRTVSKKQKHILKWLHTILLLLVFILSVISLKTVFDSHDKRLVPIPNLYSLHSWIGLGTVILFSMQLLCGFLSFLYPGIHTTYRRSYMPYHRFFGITIFVLAVISCHSGIMEKVKGSLGKEYLNLPPAAFVANFLGVTITIYAVLVVFLAAMPQFRRMPLSDEDTILELHETI